MLINQKTPITGGTSQTLGLLSPDFKVTPDYFLIGTTRRYIMKNVAGAVALPFADGRCSDAISPRDSDFDSIGIDGGFVALRTYTGGIKDAIVAGQIGEVNNNALCAEPLPSNLKASDFFPTGSSLTGFFGFSYSGLQMDGSSVVFRLHDAGIKYSGLYSSIATQGRLLRQLVGKDTLIPGGSGKFIAAISQYSLNGSNVLIATTEGGRYLSSTNGESLTKIIAEGDIFDNDKIATKIGNINEKSLSGNYFVFEMTYQDNNNKAVEGVYLATLSSTANPDPKNCLMNWAEATYPSLFSPAASTQTLAPYTYRYYKNPNAL